MPKKKVLIIDDDTRLRNLLGKYLDENNFSTILSGNTNEASKILNDNSFDLIIVDVMMPQEDGITFTSKIRRSPETSALQHNSSDISFTVNITNPGAGQVTFSLADEKTAALPGDNLIYDIFRTDSSGSKYRDLEGDIEIIERVTY